MKKVLLLFSPGGKRLLFFLLYVFLTSFSHAQYDIVVAKDGSGNYTTVQAAVNAAPSNSSARTEIYIKNGTYYEVITVPTTKKNLTFIGQSLTGTVLTYNNAANKINPATGQPYGTSNSASTFINGAGFYAQNLTFSNTANPSLGQAVAVRSTADKVIFKSCRFLGNQDTYFAHSGRSYHEACYFEGTTDFIFGAAIAFFENCNIYSKGGTSITAASTDQHVKYGFVFNNCRITGAGNAITDLGRPWRPYASVTFRNTSMSGAIKASGWNDWGNAANRATARFTEYSNSGSGYVPGSRPSWVRILTTASQAAPYTMLNVLKANSANPQVTDNWNPLTTISSTSRIALTTVSETPTANDDRFRLYPSPADHEITLQTGEVLDKNARIVIYDNLGREVFTSRLTRNISRIAVGGFSPGAYTMRVFNGKHLVTKAFLKK
jgi:pectin methylesterase-like acyl-CoA thioesterase